MPIIVRLEDMLARSKDLAQHVGITETNLSLLKSGRVKGIRFETLDAICEFLDCQPEICCFTSGMGRLVGVKKKTLTLPSPASGRGEERKTRATRPFSRAREKVGMRVFPTSITAASRSSARPPWRGP
jgi:putative transcriptional regulator